MIPIEPSEDSANLTDAQKLALYQQTLNDPNALPGEKLAAFYAIQALQGSTSVPKTTTTTTVAPAPTSSINQFDLFAQMQTMMQQQQAQYQSFLDSQKALADAATQQQQEDAIAILTKTFESYDLGSLSDTIVNLVKQGYSADTVSLLLQDTDAYKQRFAANETRRKNGMAVLSPEEYLATERAYRQIMNAAGLPAGFYDQPDDFVNMMGKDISPAELQARVQNAADAVANADPYYKSALQEMYGMTSGDMIAYVLNPERSLPMIQQKANAISFTAAAMRQGVDGIDVATAEQFGGMGVGKDQAESGFAQVATVLPQAEKLGEIYGDTYNTGDALNEVFGSNADAAQKRKRLASKEAASFSGSSGVRSGSLAQDTQGLI